MPTSSGQVVKVHLSIGFWIIATLVALGTFGVMAIFFFWITRSWVASLDDEGLTLRNGKRFLWKDLIMVRAVTVRHTSGIRLTGRVELSFYSGPRIRIVPFSTGNSEEVLAFLSLKAGSKA
jgi:hypothetical protein